MFKGPRRWDRVETARAWLAGLLFLWIIVALMSLGFLIDAFDGRDVAPAVAPGADPTNDMPKLKEKNDGKVLYTSHA